MFFLSNHIHLCYVKTNMVEIEAILLIEFGRNYAALLFNFSHIYFVFCKTKDNAPVEVISNTIRL